MTRRLTRRLSKFAGLNGGKGRLSNEIWVRGRQMCWCRIRKGVCVGGGGTNRDGMI